MNFAATARRGIGIALIVGASTLSAGCSEELGPVSMPVARVSGLVRAGDQPLLGGWIEFIPTDGTVGNLRSARIRPDGTFDANRVAIGTNAIRLVDAPIDSIAYLPLFASVRWATLARGNGGQVGPKSPARLFIPFASPIRRVIAADASAPLDVDVVAEAIKFQAEQSRVRASVPSANAEGR
jgi:hypothetical protein